jgi:hypothetical protein
MSQANADFDPGAPSDDVAPDQASIDAANLGIDGRGDVPAGEMDIQAIPADGVMTVNFNIQTAFGFLQACENSRPRITYKLGAKIPPGSEPGSGFKFVDCSGFVREEMRRSTNLGSSFPDGSVVQHDWVQNHRFSKSSVDAAKSKDGVVRIAFLSPTATRKIGHVSLIINAKTLESHGSTGPDSRDWNGGDWQGETTVYNLTSSPVLTS